MVKHTEVALRSRQRNQMIDITTDVQNAVRALGLSEGICTVCSMHTTAGVTINENADPSVTRDLLKHLAAMVPKDAGFTHGEGNSDSHIKTSLVGPGVSVPVRGGELVLGTWQAVYFCEFDGPRNRRVTVTASGE